MRRERAVHFQGAGAIARRCEQPHQPARPGFVSRIQVMCDLHRLQLCRARSSHGCRALPGRRARRTQQVFTLSVEPSLEFGHVGHVEPRQQLTGPQRHGLIEAARGHVGAQLERIALHLGEVEADERFAARDDRVVA